MQIDDKHSTRYHVINENGFPMIGWGQGWAIFDKYGTPKVNLNTSYKAIDHQVVGVVPFNHDVWPDTKDYDQNSPGIINRAEDLTKRKFHNTLDQAYWMNVLRVPICASYLAACAKVRPNRILELGTGGDSAHSTGMFLYWFQREYSPILVSVDRHPLSHVWPRYRDIPYWHFVQGDSITVMQSLGKMQLPEWYGMVFVDSSHTYPHTKLELEQAARLTHAILLDDSTHPGVKQSLEEFLDEHNEWLRVDLASAVTLIERRPYAA